MFGKEKKEKQFVIKEEQSPLKLNEQLQILAMRILELNLLTYREIEARSHYVAALRVIQTKTK